MNKKGSSIIVIAIVSLLAIIGILAALLIFNPNFSDEISAAKDFFNVAKWWALGILGAIFLWKIKFFRLIK
jgi:hypothetical protein